MRQLQSGSADHGITRNAADRIALDRQQLASFSLAVGGHPANLTTLGDTLLTTEARGLSAAGPRQRVERLRQDLRGHHRAGHARDRAHRDLHLATGRHPRHRALLRALSGDVVVTLTSDKFTFPDGNTQRLTLVHPTTSVRITAQARTSGDRLPIEVTLHTPDGQVLIAHTVLTVHSTEISFVGVALTVLAGAVLLVWWIRTWRRSRRARPRAH